MRFNVFVIIPAAISDIVGIVEQLMARYDSERPVLPFRVDITDEEATFVAQQHSLRSDDPTLGDKLSDWCGSPCYRDEHGYYYRSSDNPRGYWDGWSLDNVQTDVYQMPDVPIRRVDPLAVVTPDCVWHEMPYRWDESTHHTAQRQHLVHQLLAQYPAHVAVLVDCHR